MSFPFWYLTIGALLVALAVVRTRVRQLPITPAVIYLCIGWVLGRCGLMPIDPIKDAGWLEHFGEVGLIISLFATGLKLRAPLTSRYWRLPLVLASGSMLVTIGLLCALGVYWLKLPLPAALLLGAILAPTDPVLASDIQMDHAGDRDPLKFTLTAEAGLNDGTAFPFNMLALGLLGLRPLSENGLSWVLVDLVWAVPGGLAIGAVIGWFTGRAVLFLRQHRGQALGSDDFLALGLIAVSYGVAELLHVCGFLAVLTAGMGLRRLEREVSGGSEPADIDHSPRSSEELAKDPRLGSVYMTARISDFNDQLEHIVEFGLVLVTGALLASVGGTLTGVLVALVLILAIRPISTLPASHLLWMKPVQSAATAWFGIRGIGSLYYLFLAISHGLDRQLAETLLPIVLTVISVSVFLHGFSGTPIMTHYNRVQRREGAAEK